MFTLSYLPQRSEKLDCLAYISFEIYNLRFLWKKFFIQIQVSIQVEPNNYNIKEVPAQTIFTNQIWEHVIDFQNPQQTQPIKINDIISSNSDLKAKFLEDVEDNKVSSQNVVMNLKSKKIHLKFENKLEGTYKFLFMIKTSVENFVIPMKIRVMERKLNIVEQVIDFGVLGDPWVCL